jgi:hypothetical protein
MRQILWQNIQYEKKEIMANKKKKENKPKKSQKEIERKGNFPTTYSIIQILEKTTAV